MGQKGHMKQMRNAQKVLVRPPHRRATWQIYL